MVGMCQEIARNFKLATKYNEYTVMFKNYRPVNKKSDPKEIEWRQILASANS